MFVKIALGLIALVVVLAGGFYLWLVMAFTPPKGPDEVYEQGVSKEALFGDGGKFRYIVAWQTPDARKSDPVKYWQVMAGPSVDDISAVTILEVEGRPVPVDVRVPEGGGSLLVDFDGPLADGATWMMISVGKDYTRDQPMRVRDGAIVDAK